jgi:hypothetical protein
MSPGSIFPLQEYADLAVFSIVTPDAACISDEIIINTTIGNIGALEAKSFSLNYFLSQKISITPGDTEIGFHQIESLKPHENLTITERIKVPSNLGMKLYTLGTIIDPANNIYEENRLNNFKVADNQIQIRDC